MDIPVSEPGSAFVVPESITGAEAVGEESGQTKDDLFGLDDLDVVSDPFSVPLQDGAELTLQKPTARPRTVDKSKPDGSDKSSKKGRRQALRRTAKGLNIVYAGTITSILAGMATVIPVPFLPILCLFVAFAASISITVGHVVCLFVPDDTNAKGFIIGAVVCDLAVVGLRLFPFFLVVLSLQTLGSLLFILFLRQLAVSLKRRALADEATTLILMGCGVFALSLLIIPFGFVLALAGGLGAIIGIVLGFAFFAFGIMMLFKYLELLQHLSNAILGRQNR